MMDKINRLSHQFMECHQKSSTNWC